MRATLRLLATALFLLAASAFEAAAQVVNVDGHKGFADTTTHTVLVALTDDELHAGSLPATVSIDGTDYTVATTTLPLVRLDHADVDSLTFCPGSLTLIDPADPASPQALSVQLRYRGATALAYQKKNYAVKLLDADGQDLDAPLLGMRSDNSWILDAMASDVARMRNRVSTDFWLDFSQRPYYADLEPSMVNGTHGRFVEVFVGQRYWGLYCLTEKVDRKQLKLKKYKDGTPRGLLYKSFTYDNMWGITDPEPDNHSYTWQGWECSYPDVRKGEPIDWQPLLDLYGVLCTEMPNFYVLDHLQERIDVPLWRDYVIFCDLLHADDNVAKNIFVYFRDATSSAVILNDAALFGSLPDGTPITAPAPGPACVCPWDLDATWGRDYRQQLVDPTSNCNVSNGVNVQLWSQRDAGALYLSRWDELRHTAFVPERIWPYFARYFDLFATSGAAQRETDRWQDVDGVHLDFEAEAAYIKNWISDRITYLDGDYEFSSAGIDAPLFTDSAPLPIYLLDGRKTTNAAHGGIYIVGGKKVVK